eukprot:CAMPEP_0204844880 /NCGR_PEP_ID=MMETSP1347-20130617/660_1 /ASSEMBLY_ACC=CAM_ASM_000690 /TAXON_ID=215587 /ORGANISM="Aplanochytrium stocchinoi, Strain GSBS06" /LENGTH=471 /DNA_ID=CAMNT_0051984591 /DNA_START=37 /DNA_END=1452 /DNA_ORIENTATION=+
MNTWKEIEKLFGQVGGLDYIGEDVTQLEHALQAAKCAKDCGYDNDTILGALMHDVGHLLGLLDPHVKQMEGNLGVQNHERLGASYLVTLGFPAKTCELVGRHVDAKRYLCYKNPAYYNKLSEASKGTLKQQGGPMKKGEAEIFEKDPLMDTIIKLRTWDEAAKVVNPSFVVPDLNSYKEMIIDAVNRQRQSILEKQYKHYKLSKEQLESWDRDGYILIRDLLSEEMKQKVISWVDDIQNWPETPGKHMCYYEEEKTDNANDYGEKKLMLCRTENFIPYHEELRSLLTEDSAVTDVLEQLMNESAVLFKEKVNYKLAHGGGFPAHQDAPAFRSFGQKNHLTLNVAIDKATRENGCLEVAPGHHQSGLFPQDPTHFGLSKEEEENLPNWQHVPLNPGDVLIFSSWLPHRSGGNHTDSSRRALYITYNGETDGDFREKYYETKRKEFPQRCERKEGVDYSKGAETFNIATPIVG